MIEKNEIIDPFFIKFLDSSFLYVLQHLLEGHGFGDEYSACDFPDEDDYFEGVRFRFFDDEVLISEEEFSDLLQEKIREFMRKFPTQKKCTRALLMRFGYKLESSNSFLKRWFSK